MVRWFNIVALLLALFSVSASAQRGAHFVPAPVSGFHLSGTARGFTLRAASRQSDHFLGRRAIFFGDPFFYADYGLEPHSESAAQEVVVLQPPPAPVPEKASAGPLLLELRGDRFVRVGSENYSPEYNASLSENHSPPARELPPAVLVFRDGHKEEVRSYTITGPVIYAAADYWIQGSWTRKIQIADLDVPSTLKLNQERGSNFSLPTGPNEVVVRP